MGRIKLKPQRPSAGRFTRVVHKDAPHPNRLTPLLSFKHLLADFSASEMELPELRAVFRKLRDWSRMSWQEIIQAPRQGMGMETISEKSLRKPAPTITPDQRVLSFRIQGICRMLGCRDGQTLHVFAFDRKGDWYDHGS